MITMKNIASEANVSRSTVSMILNGCSSSVRISEKTKRRVLDVAENLGFRKNEIARAMITGKTNFIGFLDWKIYPEFISKMLTGAIEECQQNNYFVKVFSIHPEYNNFSQALSKLIEQRPAGIICRSVTERQQNLIREECERFNIPVAMIGSGPVGNWGIRIVKDDEVSAESAINYLVDSGHVRIACVSGSLDRCFANERVNGFSKGMKKAGLKVAPEHLILSGDDYNILEKDLIELFSSANRPTAVFCVTDYFAMIVLRAATKTRLRVPDDISVIGFANLTIAELTNPPLTTIAEPFEEVGKLAARELLREIGSPEKNSFKMAKIFKLKDKFLIRGSTAPLHVKQEIRV